MAYTIGPSHGPFSGAGNFVIAKPAGIRTVLSAIPSYTGHDGGSPVRYFRIGKFTLGDINGFARHVTLEYTQQLTYPLPQTYELLAYDIENGASCLFQELLEVPDLTASSPWDRTPSPLFLHMETSPVGTLGLTTAFSYTVPAGRKLWVGSARANVRRATPATGPGYVNAQILVGSGKLVNLYAWGNTVGQSAEDISPQGGLVLSAGSVILGQYFVTDVGGQVFILMTLTGFLFDA